MTLVQNAAEVAGELRDTLSDLGERFGQEIGDLPGVRRVTHPARSRLPRWLRTGLRQTEHEGLVIDQHVREGRFQRGLAAIAGLSAIAGGFEVTQQHYQGSYGQRIMYSPVLISPLVTLAGIWGAFNRRAARVLLPLASLALLVDGVVGFVFHIRGVQRKPGGWRIPVVNVTMGPPLFAPLLLGISGFLGLIATFLRREDDPAVELLAGSRMRTRTGILTRPSLWSSWLPRGITREGLELEQHIREGRFQRLLGAATAVSALFNGFESLYSHYRNGFRYRTQWIPVLLSPPVIAAGIGTVFSKRAARTALPLTSLAAALVGGWGTWLHARGIARRPGGLKKPVYNALYGPPLFAPLLFAATGFLGLLASLLRRAH